MKNSSTCTIWLLLFDNQKDDKKDDKTRKALKLLDFRCHLFENQKDDKKDDILICDVKDGKIFYHVYFCHF